MKPEGSPILRMSISWVLLHEPKEIKCSLKLLLLNYILSFISKYHFVSAFIHSKTIPWMFWFLFQTCSWREFLKMMHIKHFLKSDVNWKDSKSWLYKWGLVLIFINRLLLCFSCVQSLTTVFRLYSFYNSPSTYSLI